MPSLKQEKPYCFKQLANAIRNNHPEVYFIILLIDERPEEVTDMQRSVQAEVLASTFDEQATRHVRVADIALKKAKTTRRIRTRCSYFIGFNYPSCTRPQFEVAPPSGKMLSEGVESNALYAPKRFFGAARKVEQGGSLTIIATALIETGSKMDEVIFEEFKGTG